MRTMFVITFLVLLGTSDCFAQRSAAQRARRSAPIVEHPQPVGEAGIAWYTTWKSGLEEAERSERPIFFMAAATCSRGVPGTF